MFRQTLTRIFAPSSTGVFEGAKRVRKFLILLLFLIILSAMFIIPASALTPVYFKHAQPQVTSNSCYVEVSYGGQHYFLYVFGSTASEIDNGDIYGNEYFICSYIGNNTLRIQYSSHNGVATDDTYNTQTYVKAYWVSSDGKTWDVESVDNGVNFTIGPEETRNNIRFYGLLDVPWSYTDWGASDYVFVYGSDSVLNQKLDDIKNAINNSNSNADKNASDIQANADKNASDIQANADKNAQQIQQNDDENTQAIIDNQNQLQENEKTEANSSGNGGVDDVSNAIPNYSTSLLSAFNNLTNGMKHQNTDCVITIPEIKMPVIPKFWNNEIKLLDEQKIYIEEYVALIPTNIIKVIRAVLTIALLIFCYKEFYGVIEYITTLRGNG